MAATCRIGVLGGFRVEIDGRAVPAEAWRHSRGTDLVKLLAISPGHRLHREQVIDTLWPALPPPAGGANLRKAILFARRALGSPDALVVESGVVRLAPTWNVEVDAERFEDAASGALDEGDATACAVATKLYTGELLPDDPYAEWARDARERLRLRFVEALKRAGLWDRVVDLDPLDEEAHRALIRIHLEAGDRHAAMRQFERLRDVLREELGVAPDRETVALYKDVLALEGLEPATPQERARASLDRGLLALSREDLDEAERQAKETRALAIEFELGRELGEASGLLGMVAHMRGRWRDVFRDEFVATVLEAPHLTEPVFDAHLCLAEFSLYGEEGTAAVETFAGELLEIAEGAASVHGTALATLMLGECALLSGNLQSAEERLSRAADLHGRAGASAGRALALQRLGEAAIAARRVVRARRLLRDAMSLAQTSPLSSHLLIRVHGAMVQAAPGGRATAVISEAERRLSNVGVCEPCSMGFLVAAAIASARSGDLEDARRHLDHAERVAVMWQGGPWMAAVWEARGELRLAEGDRDRASALFSEAADGFARAGHPLAEARTRAAAGG